VATFLTKFALSDERKMAFLEPSNRVCYAAVLISHTECLACPSVCTSAPYKLTNQKQDQQALLKAKYCPQAAAV